MGRRCLPAMAVGSEVVDHISNERELIMVAAKIISPVIVRVIKSKFGTNRDEFVRRPHCTDAMLRIVVEVGPTV